MHTIPPRLSVYVPGKDCQSVEEVALPAVAGCRDGCLEGGRRGQLSEWSEDGQGMCQWRPGLPLRGLRGGRESGGQLTSLVFCCTSFTTVSLLQVFPSGSVLWSGGRANPYWTMQFFFLALRNNHHQGGRDNPFSTDVCPLAIHRHHPFPLQMSLIARVDRVLSPFHFSCHMEIFWIFQLGMYLFHLLWSPDAKWKWQVSMKWHTGKWDQL